MELLCGISLVVVILLVVLYAYISFKKYGDG